MNLQFHNTVRLMTRYFPSVLFMGSALIALYQASGFPAAAGGIPGPALVPQLFAAVLGVIGVVLAVQNWRERDVTAPTISEKSDVVDTPETNIPRGALPALILALCTYALIMPCMGIVSTTILLLYGCLRLFGHAGGIRAWAFAIAVSYVLLFIFDYVMQVPLPKGWLG